MLVEVNAHSLFSKWFSESGKLVSHCRIVLSHRLTLGAVSPQVMKLFQHIEDLADDPECFVAVLIDEVESLAASRADMGSDPGDATRYAAAVPLPCLSSPSPVQIRQRRAHFAGRSPTPTKHLSDVHKQSDGRS